MDIKIVDENNQAEAQEMANPQGLDVPSDLLLNDVAQLLKIDLNEVGKYKHKLETIIEYAKTKTDSKEAHELKWVIKSLGLKLGTPPLGERLVDQMNLYAKIHLQELALKKEKERIIRGGDFDDDN